MLILTYLLLAFCITSTLLSLSRNQKWWIRMFDFPFAQLTVMSLFSIVGLYFFSDLSDWVGKVIMGLAVANFIYQCVIVIPYTPVYPVMAQSNKKPVGDISISLLSANVLQFNKKTSLLKDLICEKNPDVITLLETDDFWYEEMKYLEKEYPHNVTVPIDNTYGLLYFSRLEFAKHEVNYLVEKGVPSVDSVVKMRNGQHVRLFVVHPPPPSPSENEESAERDGELLIVGKMVKKETLPCIVVGDLNDVAWSHTTRLFQRTADLLDPRIGRGFFNTFHADYPLLRWPLDHIFHSNHFRVVSLERLSHIGSDHFPIFIHLNYEPEAQAEQESEKEDAEDREEAQEKITYALNKSRSSNLPYFFPTLFS